MNSSIQSLISRLSLASPGVLRAADGVRSALKAQRGSQIADLPRHASWIIPGAGAPPGAGARVFPIES